MSINRIILFLLVILSLGCSTNSITIKPDNQPSFKSLLQVSHADSMEAKAFYLKGISAFELGDKEAALDYLTNAMIKLPHSSGILFALSDTYLAIDDQTNAIYYANESIKIEPKNVWFRLKLVQIHEKNNDYDAAIEALTALMNIDGSKVDYYYKLADLHTKKLDYESANSIYALMLKKYGSDEILHFRRYVNFTSLGNKDSALVELDILSRINPSDLSISYSLAELQLSLGKETEGIETLSSILEKQSDDKQALSLLLRYLIQEKKWTILKDKLSEILSNEAISFVNKEQIVRSILALVQQKAQEYANELEEVLKSSSERLVSEYSSKSAAYLLSAQVQNTLQNDTLAEVDYKKAIELESGNQQAWLELVQLWLRQNKLNELIENEDKIDAAVPENAFIQYAIGAAYFSKFNYEAAIIWLKKASYTPARREFKSVIFAIMGDSYHEIDNWPKASEAYESAIKFDPNNATVLNNFAYYLSVRNEKLNEAKLMSKKSLDIEPENSSFLDTYGWILYQIGEYDEAKIYVQKSIEVGGASAEVYEHLGDIYLKLGNKEEAINYWKQAFSMDSERNYLKKRIQDAS